MTIKILTVEGGGEGWMREGATRGEALKEVAVVGCRAYDGRDEGGKQFVGVKVEVELAQ